jgi:hypothetical protein
MHRHATSHFCFCLLSVYALLPLDAIASCVYRVVKQASTPPPPPQIQAVPYWADLVFKGLFRCFSLLWHYNYKSSGNKLCAGLHNEIYFLAGEE